MRIRRTDKATRKIDELDEKQLMEKLRPRAVAEIVRKSLEQGQSVDTGMSVYERIETGEKQ